MWNVTYVAYMTQWDDNVVQMTYFNYSQRKIPQAQKCFYISPISKSKWWIGKEKKTNKKKIEFLFSLTTFKVPFFYVQNMFI